MAVVRGPHPASAPARPVNGREGVDNFSRLYYPVIRLRGELLERENYYVPCTSRLTGARAGDRKWKGERDFEQLELCGESVLLATTGC